MGHRGFLFVLLSCFLFSLSARSNAVLDRLLLNPLCYKAGLKRHMDRLAVGDTENLCRSNCNRNFRTSCVDPVGSTDKPCAAKNVSCLKACDDPYNASLTAIDTDITNACNAAIAASPVAGTQSSPTPDQIGDNSDKSSRSKNGDFLPDWNWITSNSYCAEIVRKLDADKGNCGASGQVCKTALDVKAFQDCHAASDPYRLPANTLNSGQTNLNQTNSTSGTESNGAR